jgi:hypothetical protein
MISSWIDRPKEPAFATCCAHEGILARHTLRG